MLYYVPGRQEVREARFLNAIKILHMANGECIVEPLCKTLTMEGRFSEQKLRSFASKLSTSANRVSPIHRDSF
jgi:hypothetical protein